MEAKELGEFIAANRKKRQITQADLAKMLNVTDKAVSRWERGLGFPDINTLEPLAEALGVTLTELMRCSCETDNNLDKEIKSKDEGIIASIEMTSNAQITAFSRLCLCLLSVATPMMFSSDFLSIFS